MKTINAAIQLKADIAVLEDRQARDWYILKQALEATSQAFSPSHIARTVLEETTSLPLFKNTMIKTLIGLGTGWFSGKLINGNKEQTVKKSIGSVVQFALAYFAANHADGIRTVGEKLFHKFFGKKQTPPGPESFSHNGTHIDEVTSLYNE